MPLVTTRVPTGVEMERYMPAHTPPRRPRLDLRLVLLGRPSGRADERSATWLAR